MTIRCGASAFADLPAYFRLRGKLLQQGRRGLSGDPAEKTAREVLRQVRIAGDRAVLSYTRRWDKARLRSLRVSGEEFRAAEKFVTAEDRAVMEAVARRFRQFYNAQHLRGAPFVDHSGFYSERVTPLDRVGLYVPGGRHSLISSLFMQAIPADVADVPERFVATPPRPDGKIPPLLLAAARIANVTAVFKMGGAQAIAAFACGTRTVPKVDKVFGPGNRYVTAAKRLVFGDVGIDMLAGPSELVVIADETARPVFVAEDLLAQSEHGPDSLSLLLTDSPALAGAVRDILQVEGGSYLKQIFISVLASPQACCEAAAKAAPEHVSLQVREPEKLLPLVGPAGAIFLGPTAVAYGDYIAGPNHTLPTAGAARFSSPLALESFFRRSSILSVRDPDGELTRLGAIMAEWEGLSHHARSLRARRAP